MRNNDPNVQALEQIIRKYKNTVYGIAAAMLRNRHEADDVFQEVFLLYYKKNIGFDSENARRSWLIRTTVNKCRQANNSVWNTRVEKTDEIEIVEEFGFSGEESRVFSAVRELDDKYRLVVILHYFQGLAIAEIAELQDERPNTVSVRLNRARKLLKERLEEDDENGYF
ncbi:MAG: sigma-70 family RNA polymerase sigma factor [Ruminococcus sp.]|nr:sigma-70 family RNA polymerase sigma factor [Ruminococcus sp.]